MATFQEKLAQICWDEYARFENGVRTETQDPQYKYVGEYWASIGINYDGRTKVKNIRPAWSSAFVSFAVRKAGAGARFKYTQAHCHYVDQAMKKADGEGAANYGYIARKPGAYAPKVGDILVAGREYAKRYDYDQAKLVYRADSFYPSHGDIVVKVNANSVETIGGNVSVDTVGRRVRAIGANGRLTSSPWIAVLECVL
ncbi:MAG: DUF2272 domain-containing protein [Hyphomonadaceae bacterium]